MLCREKQGVFFHQKEEIAPQKWCFVCLRATERVHNRLLNFVFLMQINLSYMCAVCYVVTFFSSRFSLLHFPTIHLGCLHLGFGTHFRAHTCAPTKTRALLMQSSPQLAMETEVSPSASHLIEYPRQWIASRNHSLSGRLYINVSSCEDIFFTVASIWKFLSAIASRLPYWGALESLPRSRTLLSRLM